MALALFRDGERTLAPGGGVTLRAGDDLLLAGRLKDRGALHSTMTKDPTASYVLDGRRVPAGWLWRKFSKAETSEGHQAEESRIS